MEPFARKRVATRLGAVPVGEPGAVEVLTSVVSRNVVASPLSGLHCALLQIELVERIPLAQGGSRALGSDGGPYEDFVSLGHVTFGQILVLRDPDGDEISLVVVPGIRDYLEARGEVRVAYVSGWAALANARTRASAHELIPYSDHASFTELLDLVAASGAGQIDVVHGYAEPFARILRNRGYQAQAAIAQMSREEEPGA